MLKTSPTTCHVPFNFVNVPPILPEKRPYGLSWGGGVAEELTCLNVLTWTMAGAASGAPEAWSTCGLSAAHSLVSPTPNWCPETSFENGIYYGCNYNRPMTLSCALRGEKGVRINCLTVLVISRRLAGGRQRVCLARFHCRPNHWNSDAGVSCDFSTFMQNPRDWMKSTTFWTACMHSIFVQAQISQSSR